MPAALSCRPSRYPFLLALLAASLSARAEALAADEVPEKHSLFLTAFGGSQHFDSNLHVDDGFHGRAAMGFRFSDTWSGELSAGRSPTQATVPTTTPTTVVDADTVQLDAVRHWRQRPDAWQPYTVAGIGQEEVSAAGGASSTGTFANLGVGVFRRLPGPFYFRAGARAAYVFDNEALHSFLELGLGVDVGGNYDGLAPRQTPAAPDTPAPPPSSATPAASP